MLIGSGCQGVEEGRCVNNGMRRGVLEGYVVVLYFYFEDSCLNLYIEKIYRIVYQRIYSFIL